MFPRVGHLSVGPLLTDIPFVRHEEGMYADDLSWATTLFLLLPFSHLFFPPLLFPPRAPEFILPLRGLYAPNSQVSNQHDDFRRLHPGGQGRALH